MKKKLFLSVICFFFAGLFFFCSAQIVSKSYSSPVMQAFIKGKTYAVLTNDTVFNQWLRSTLVKQWKVSPLMYIYAAQLDTSVISDKNFFLFPQAKDDKTTVFHLLNSDDIARKKEFYLMLSQGGYKQTKLLFTPTTNGPKILAAFRYDPARADLTGGMAEAEIMISFMNQSLQGVIDRKIRSEVKDSVRWVITDENAKQIRDKTLLINEAYYDETISLDDKPLITDKVLDDYPFTYQFIRKDSTAIIMNDESGTFCYLFLYFPTPRFKTTDDSGDILVYDPSQKKILYLDDNIDGPWFEKWKMKAMVGAIKSK